MKTTIKIIKKLFVIHFFMIAFISCNTDFLETKPLTEYSEVDVWEGEDPALMEAFITKIYTDIEHGYTKYPSAAFVDESDARGYANTLNHNNGNDSPTTTFYWHMWPRLYKLIRYCNIALENIDRSPVDESLKDRIRGEAHFLRAYHYHQLVKLYGGVPIIKETFNLSDNFSVPRDSYSDCIEFITNECDEAANLLPLEHSGNDNGRATKGAALALKSRVLVHAASDLYHKTNDIFPNYSNPELLGHTDGNQSDRWRAAKAAAKAVIDIGQYSLYMSDPSTNDSISKNYVDLFTSYGNEEDIFVKYFTPTIWGGANLCPLQLWFPNGFGGRGNNAPIGNLVDAFEMIDGSPFDWDNPTHAIEPYKNRDPRFHAFIIYEGSFVRDVGRDEALKHLDPSNTLQVGVFEKWNEDAQEKELVYGLDSRQGPSRNHEASYTGYYIRKFMDQTIDGWYYAQDIPWRFIRYAEVIFNYAEACIELGEYGEARNYLNLIRKRAGMPDITESGPELRERFRNEKRIEMAFENQRFYDVRRWVIGNETYGPTYAADVLYPLLDDKTTAKTPIINHKVFQTRSWDNKMYYRPIYHNEILSNPTLIQNPGY